MSYKCFIKEIMFGVMDLNVMFGMLYSKLRTGFEMGFKNPSIPSRLRKEIAFSLLFFQGRIYYDTVRLMTNWPVPIPPIPPSTLVALYDVLFTKVNGISKLFIK